MTSMTQTDGFVIGGVDTHGRHHAAVITSAASSAIVSSTPPGGYRCS